MVLNFLNQLGGFIRPRDDTTIISLCPFQRSVVSIIITLDALLESNLLGTAAGLRTSLHLYP